MAATGGRGNPHNGTTGKYHRQTPVRIGCHSGDTENTYGTGKRTIGNDGGTLKVMDQKGDQGKRLRKGTVVQTGEYSKVSILVCTHPGGIGMDDDGTHT